MKDDLLPLLGVLGILGEEILRPKSYKLVALVHIRQIIPTHNFLPHLPSTASTSKCFLSYLCTPLYELCEHFDCILSLSLLYTARYLDVYEAHFIAININKTYFYDK